VKAFTKISVRRTKHRGLTESMITLEVEVVKKCEDFPFGTQYFIFQFQANAHPYCDKWDLLDEMLGTNLEIPTLLASSILAHISSAQASLACSFTTDVIKGMVERITKWWKEDMYHVPRLVHEKLLVAAQKEESC
jgi:hypothetical protein